jgi:hypothetical protein
MLGGHQSLPVSQLRRNPNLHPHVSQSFAPRAIFRVWRSVGMDPSNDDTVYLRRICRPQLPMHSAMGAKVFDSKARGN